MPRYSQWTYDQEAALKMMKEQGYKTQQIVNIMNKMYPENGPYTRNTIIGKWDRMKKAGEI